MNTPKYQQHPNFKTALRNEEFHNLLQKSDSKYHYWEWMLTMQFYTVLHYVKTLLSIIYGLSPAKIDSHRGIQSELNRLKKQGRLPKRLIRSYEQFKNDSELARYHYLENYSVFNDLEFVKFVQNSCSKRFISIREYVIHEIKQIP